ncbi:ElyC/SanA/YdcF family protein [Brevibacillus centrosporus]|uniref:ElyC/SanA/YdcF family protein n=1 Tax=Brevibacillus centrosporus TaxID=54910 RepID=UPI002E1A1204|nr:ElyC/SanA/YdcF family protein [Brevibacillus centrosporus]
MNKSATKMSLALLLGLSLLSSSTVYASTAPVTTDSLNVSSVRNDEATSYRLNQLKEIAMYYYWHGGDLQKAEKEIFKGVTLKGKYDVVENAFKEATLIDPYDINLKFSLASAQLVQKKYADALATYKQILNLDPDNFQANLLFGLYSKLNGDEASYQASLAKMKSIDPKMAQEFLDKYNTTDDYIKVKFNTEVPANIPVKGHAIVILGYALADDGTMREPMIERLKVGLAIAQKYPGSKIVVTGGVPKQGITESDAMTDWLVKQGIDQNRIIPENKSTDTVENALFTTAILEKENITDVTIVSSASHMRRALSVFQEATNFYSKMNNANAIKNFSNAVYLDYPTLEEAQKVTKDETFVIYRDLFRVSGIWQFPGIQR